MKSLKELYKTITLHENKYLPKKNISLFNV